MTPLEAAMAADSTTTARIAASRCASPASSPVRLRRSPVIGLTAAFRTTLAQIGARTSSASSARMPTSLNAATTSSASAALVPWNGPTVVSPSPAWKTSPGPRNVAPWLMTAPSTRRACSAMTSSLPSPFWSETKSAESQKCRSSATARAVS